MQSPQHLLEAEDLVIVHLLRIPHHLLAKIILYKYVLEKKLVFEKQQTNAVKFRDKVQITVFKKATCTILVTRQNYVSIVMHYTCYKNYSNISE